MKTNLFLMLFLSSTAWAIPQNRNFLHIKNKIIRLEQALIQGLKLQKNAKNQLKKIRVLLRLQKEEKSLYQARLLELESTIQELGLRKKDLEIKINNHRMHIKKSLREIHRSRDQASRAEEKFFANRVDYSLKEMEAYKADLEDSNQLELKITEEKQHLSYAIQELTEQESVLELNRQIQLDLLEKKVGERIKQLENYRNLKDSEAKVEKMIFEFNARKELEKTLSLNPSVKNEEFEKNKGRLGLPVSGQVVSFFGKSFDPHSNLYVFKKGVEIQPFQKNQPVASVFAGKTAFSGELPHYGRVMIIDHGSHYYSLIGKLGELYKKSGESVRRGEIIGQVDNSGNPIYFEIRSRNIAVNPMQWISKTN